ncbi:putative dual-specificity RNA methyltransferase RlmN [Candidatus Rubidus massiliensis]|nr:MAG: 23S rRNA (adenine(2503)-C(2))-methyltransferase [Chlamydia sp. 32-24]CDZ80900.1 putative dual-specificity RNA methyltransferase RlmN [Candidatus Rubidus massiliensis]
MNLFSLISLTHQEYSELIFSKLNKGKTHAGLIYEEFFRKGYVKGENRAFLNAQNLLKDILSLTDLSIPKLSGEKTDGKTGKFLLKTDDDLDIESVIIPMRSGHTLCVSSQIGCNMGCTFCETGRMGLIRNLSVEEIIAQVFHARFSFGISLKNIVFMGMGEPFDNYENVKKACLILMDPKGFGFGKNHITVSTSGKVDEIYRFAEEKDFVPNLAVSLNASSDLIRQKIMPINRKANMKALYEAMYNYCNKSQREILVAYVLIEGVNDQLNHVDELANYLQGLNVKVNLIPYNHQSCERYKAPCMESIEAFAKQLQQRGFYTLLRLTKGDKIMAACGQLGNLSLRKNKTSLKISL